MYSPHYHKDNNTLCALCFVSVDICTVPSGAYLYPTDIFFMGATEDILINPESEQHDDKNKRKYVEIVIQY